MKLVFIAQMYRDARSIKHKIRKESFEGRTDVHCYLLKLLYYVLFRNEYQEYFLEVDAAGA